jgi:hypothetical protein
LSAHPHPCRLVSLDAHEGILRLCENAFERPSKKPPGTWAVAKRLKKPRTWAVRRGQATSGNLRSSTWKPSLAIWAAKRLALISVER